MEHSLEQTIDNIKKFVTTNPKLANSLYNKIDKEIQSLSNTEDGGTLIFKFGKFKGSLVKDVPSWYLLWCHEQDWFKKHNAEMYSYIKHNLRKLKKKAEAERRENIEPELHSDWGNRD